MGRSARRIRPPRPGLQARLFFAFVGVALVPLLLLAGLHHQQLLRHAADDAELRAARLAEVQRLRIDADLERLQDEVDLVASRTQMRISLAALAADRDPVHGVLIRRIIDDARASASDVMEIWVRDASATVVASSGVGLESGRGDRALPEPGDPALGLDWSNGEGLRSIWSTKSLYHEGKGIGTLHVRLSVATLRTVLHDVEDEEQVTCALVVADEDGQVRRARGGFAEAARGSTFVSQVETMRRSPEGASAFAMRRIDTVPGYVIAEVTLASVTSAMGDQIEMLGANLVALLFLATLSAWMAARMVARPVRALREATLRLRRGEHGVRVVGDAWGEFAVLNHSFNEMAKRVELSRRALQREVLRSRSAQRELADIAHHDPLTGLLNRRRFLELLDEAASASSPSGALLYIDLDDFKPINDRHGHEVGDEVLRIVAGRLERLVRAGDHIARLGGDEFAVLLAQDLPVTEVSHLTARIRVAISDRMMVHGRRLHVRCSVGHAALDSDPDPQQVLDRADRAMYRDKSRHRRAAGRTMKGRG